MNSLEWFTVSPLGNGVGLTVLRLEKFLTHGGPVTLIFHILPKFWRLDENGNPKEKNFWTLSLSEIAESSDTSTFEFEIYEQDCLGVSTAIVDISDQETSDNSGASTIPSQLFEALMQVAVGEVSQEELEETEENAQVISSDHAERKSPLWKKYSSSVPASSYRQLEFLKCTEENLTEAGKIRSFWQMLDTFNAQVEPVTNSQDFASAGLALFAENPSLRPYIYRRFIDDTYEALHDRRPRYIPVQEEVGSVRGALVTEGLIKREINKSPKILCEFDELTTNNHIWRTIRIALESVVPELGDFPQSFEKALLCDAQLQDVSVQAREEVLADAQYFVMSRNESEFVQKSYQLALAILRHQYHATVEDNAGSGVIANLKYSMNGVWEQMVEGFYGAQKSVVTSESGSAVPTVNVFYEYSEQEKSWGKLLDGGKKPDVLVSVGDSKFYLDAKYKDKELGVKKASMSDQYQMATYALRTKRNVYLVYPAFAGQQMDFKEIERQHIPYCDDFKDRSKAPATNSYVITGQFFLPFPGPTEVGKVSSGDFYTDYCDKILDARELARNESL